MREQPVRELMSTSPVTVPPDMPFKQLVRVLEEHRIDAVPVVDGDRLLGVVSSYDLTAHEEEPPPLTRLVLGGRQERLHARKGRARTARELMSPPAQCVDPGTTVPEALRKMTRAHVGRVVVVDDGRVVGVLTRSDVLRCYLRDDADLQREVQEAVHRAVTCDGDVAVDVRDGVVTLSGWVERSTCSWAAASAVRGVPGVVDLDHRLGYRVDDTLPQQLALHGPYV